MWLGHGKRRLLLCSTSLQLAHTREAPSSSILFLVIGLSNAKAGFPPYFEGAFIE